MLTQLEEKQQECSALYWSDNDRITFNNIAVQLKLCKNVGGYIYREFTLTHQEVCTPINFANYNTYFSALFN